MEEQDSKKEFSPNWFTYFSILAISYMLVDIYFHLTR